MCGAIEKIIIEKVTVPFFVPDLLIPIVNKEGKIIGAKRYGDLIQAGAKGTGCLAVGTQLLTDQGFKSIELFKVGDRVLTKNEHDPESNISVGIVEQVTRRYAGLLSLNIQGRIIRLTSEHPFYSRDGWIEAGSLQVNDMVLGSQGEWLKVEAVGEHSEHEVVYNLEIRSFHTYFIGDKDWEFAVWVHNVDCARILELQKKLHSSKGGLTAAETAELKQLKDIGVIEAEAFVKGSLGKKVEFGDHLRSMIGGPPKDMVDPHAHHILFKKGLGEAQQKLVEEGQAILRKVGIDPVYDKENLVWAPWRVAGQHSGDSLRKVVDKLKELDKIGASYDDFVNALKKLGRDAANQGK